MLRRWNTSHLPGRCLLEPANSQSIGLIYATHARTHARTKMQNMRVSSKWVQIVCQATHSIMNDDVSFWHKIAIPPFLICWVVKKGHHRETGAFSFEGTHVPFDSRYALFPKKPREIIVLFPGFLGNNRAVPTDFPNSRLPMVLSVAHLKTPAVPAARDDLPPSRDIERYRAKARHLLRGHARKKRQAQLPGSSAAWCMGMSFRRARGWANSLLEHLEAPSVQPTFLHLPCRGDFLTKLAQPK